MQSANEGLGKKVTKYAGWGITLVATIYTITGYIDIASDASTRAYAPLIFIEGGFFIAIGLVVLWLGYRNTNKPKD
ncbi:hypothetical protein [Calditerrivibrio nitroreducens]|uniref:Sugar transporter, putative n=1 Tax=Calditerrivibrio nitroreducens (strain DSM 19672 / NBRC 101217 / Yu37-1) TaxID=768670 RepID=E4TK91_CALNY|nr:hypothetical protein [Calditerrivibrio nitroreducens]ADR19963.1 sugar transporter, putative [Calditerrivibrio nitroreducens DSM 19672]